MRSPLLLLPLLVVLTTATSCHKDESAAPSDMEPVTEANQIAPPANLPPGEGQIPAPLPPAPPTPAPLPASIRHLGALLVLPPPPNDVLPGYASASAPPFEVARKAELIVQANEEHLKNEARLAALAKEEGEEGEDDVVVPRLLTVSELEELVASTQLVHAAEMAHAAAIGDQQKAVQVAYYELLKARSLAASLATLAPFYTQLVDHAARVVDIGEASPAWLDRIKARSLTTERELIAAKARAAELEVTVARLGGGIAGGGFLAAPGACSCPEGTAIERSYVMKEINHRREAVLAKIRGDKWLLTQATDAGEQLQLIHQIKIEESKAAVLTIDLDDAASRIRTGITQATIGLDAANAQLATIDGALLALESAFAAAPSRIESGDEDLFEALELADRVVATRHAREELIIEAMARRASLQRALEGGTP